MPAKYERFEDLPAWKAAALLYNQTLDLFDDPSARLSSGFRSQLDRAALSVSNNIAEGFERITTNELVSFLSIAKGSAGEVRSMISAVIERPNYQTCRQHFSIIQATARNCCRQLGAWIQSLQDVPDQRKRRLDGSQRVILEAQRKAMEFRRQFLRGLKPEHPLYHTSEARAARAETTK